MDKFCYLGDMLSVDGDADAAVANWIESIQAVGTIANVCEVVACKETKWGGTSGAEMRMMCDVKSYK